MESQLATEDSLIEILLRQICNMPDQISDSRKPSSTKDGELENAQAKELIPLILRLSEMRASN
jgi:hypothetical protein